MIDEGTKYYISKEEEPVLYRQYDKSVLSEHVCYWNGTWWLKSHVFGPGMLYADKRMREIDKEEAMELKKQITKVEVRRRLVWGTQAR